MYFERTIKKQVVEAMRNFPVVLITGARQVGKSTLALELLKNYLTLDDLNVYNSLQADPQGFVDALKKPVAIDEVQKMTSIFKAIKLDVDRHRINGNYLLTGSANIMAYQDITESLAGRIALIELLPLSGREIDRCADHYLDHLFEVQLNTLSYQPKGRDQIIERIINGGYPEIQKISSSIGRYQWFSSYIRSYIERDVRDIGELRNLDKFIRMSILLSSRSGNLLNKTDIARDSDINLKTLENYLELLKIVYQISILQPYSTNIDKRLTKTGKLFFLDSGILAHMLGISSAEEFNGSPYKGNLFETYIYAELLKAVKYSDTPTRIYFFRTVEQHEIDFIIERNKKLIALEIKMAQHVRKEDFRHISFLAAKDSRLTAGYVLYMGDKVLPFGKNLFALPVSAIC